MARPITARAAPAPFEVAPLVGGGTGVPVLELDGPTGVLDPVSEEIVAVALLEGVGMPVPVPVPVTMVVGE
jgi:hypothetical protein